MKFNISLFSVLLVLVCMLGYVEMVSTFISHHRPLLARFNPQVSLVIIRGDIQVLSFFYSPVSVA